MRCLLLLRSRSCWHALVLYLGNVCPLGRLAHTMPCHRSGSDASFLDCLWQLITTTIVQYQPQTYARALRRVQDFAILTQMLLHFRDCWRCRETKSANVRTGCNFCRPWCVVSGRLRLLHKPILATIELAA